MTAQPEFKKISTMLRDTRSLTNSIKQVRENFLTSPIFQRKTPGSNCFLSIFSEPIDQQYDSIGGNNNFNLQEAEKKFGKLNYSTDSSEEIIDFAENIHIYTPLNKRNDSNGKKLQETWNMTPATTASSVFYHSGFNNFNITDNCFKSEKEKERKIKGTPLQKSATPFTPHYYTPQLKKIKLLELDSIAENSLIIKEKISDILNESWQMKLKFNKFKSFLKVVILLKIKYKKEDNRTGNLILSYISRHSADKTKKLASNIQLNIPVPIFQ
jgi:hypothetical protein